MSRVYWDSMLFIYMIEGNPQFGPRVKAVLDQMKRRGDSLCTSVFTLGEVLTGPRKVGANDVVEKVRRYFFSGGQVEMLPFTAVVSDRYSVIRATTSATPADSIHLACAAEAGVDLFLTHDKRLHKLLIPGIQFIAGLDAQLFPG